MSTQTLVLSLRPEFAEKVFQGKKTVELRRVRPRLKPGDKVLVYVPSPVKALIGHFQVRKVIQAEPQSLWQRVGRNAGITREQFMAYYDGARVAFGILLHNQKRLSIPVPLGLLQRTVRRFRPPQCYQYLDPGQTDAILLLGSRC
jgi:predicted transcriptional regulator